MTDCPNYVADPSFQMTPAYSSSSVDCTAHSASNAIDHATCGGKDPGGRMIRGLTDEPIPDPLSPGLNLPQVARVAYKDYGVYLDVRIGARRVTWYEYEKRRLAGQGAIIQLNYGPIADSRYDAFRHAFRGGHAMFETLHATYDPGADGRYTGCWKFDGSVYDRETMKRAAGLLFIGNGVRVGYGYVWAAFTRDVVPNYVARVPAGDFWAYNVVNGVVQYRRKRTTAAGFIGACTAPLSYPKKGGGSYTLVKLLTGSRAGKFISANYAKETP